MGLWAQVAVFSHVICIILDCLGQVCSWVELPVQRRLCSIFVRDFRSPYIHECFRGLMGSQRTPGIRGVTVHLGPIYLRPKIEEI